MITPPPKYTALRNHIPYPPYEEDKIKKRSCATEYGETRHRTCSIKDRLGTRLIPAKQRLGSRRQVTYSQTQNKSPAKIKSIPEQEAQSSLKSYIPVVTVASLGQKRGIHHRLGPKSSNVKKRLRPQREVAKEDLERGFRMPCHTHAFWSGGHESKEET